MVVVVLVVAAFVRAAVMICIKVIYLSVHWVVVVVVLGLVFVVVGWKCLVQLWREWCCSGGGGGDEDGCCKGGSCD